MDSTNPNLLILSPLDDVRDNKVQNLAQTNLDMLVSGAPLSVYDADMGSVLRFDGVSDCLRSSAPIATNLLNGLTIEMWVCLPVCPS